MIQSINRLPRKGRLYSLDTAVDPLRQAQRARERNLVAGRTKLEEQGKLHVRERIALLVDDGSPDWRRISWPTPWCRTTDSVTSSRLAMHWRQRKCATSPSGTTATHPCERGVCDGARWAIATGGSRTVGDAIVHADQTMTGMDNVPRQTEGGRSQASAPSPSQPWTPSMSDLCRDFDELSLAG